LGLPHPMAHGLFWCICDQAINPTRIHLFCRAHGGKHTTTHDVVWNSFTSIVRDVRFHVFCKQTHAPNTISLVITTMSGYCVYCKWYSHFDRHSYYLFNLCESYFANCFFLGISYDDGNSGKGCFISQLTP